MKLQTLATTLLAARSISSAAAKSVRGGAEADTLGSEGHNQPTERQLKRHHAFRLFEDGVEPQYRELGESDGQDLPQDALDRGELLLRGGAEEDDQDIDVRFRDAMRPDPRIIGGKPASRSYDWHCHLSDNIGPFCGASLVSNNCVVTAAHCLGGSYDVVCARPNINSNSGQSKRMRKEYKHPQYNSRTTENDFAIVCVDGSFNGITPVKLNSDASTPRTGESITVLGVGDTNKGNGVDLPDELREVTVQAISNAECERSEGCEGNFCDSYKGQIEDNMLCARANGKDACQGDSGGPAFVMDGNQVTLVGIVSWGIGCASQYFPGVYARVSEAVSWMEQQVEKEGGTVSTGGGNGGNGSGNGGNSGGNGNGGGNSGNDSSNGASFASSGGSSGGGSSSGGSSSGGSSGGGGGKTVFSENFSNGQGQFTLGQDAKRIETGKWRTGVLRVQRKGAATSDAIDVKKYNTCQVEMEVNLVGMTDQDQTCVQFAKGNGNNANGFKDAGCVGTSKGMYNKKWYEKTFDINVKNSDKLKVRVQSKSRTRKNDTLIDIIKVRCT